VYKVLKAKRQT